MLDPPERLCFELRDPLASRGVSGRAEVTPKRCMGGAEAKATMINEGEGCNNGVI